MSVASRGTPSVCVLWAQTPKDVILAAVKEVAENQRSIRPVAEEYGINFMTLQRYVKKYEKAGPNEGNKISTGYLRTRQILTPFQENELAVYVIECSRIYHGVEVG
ncbi:Transposase [Popillia japonica]|uniref:Transposase n=1 Tax=Popillia japonica TaxID=7064 RepID=A0AAW1KNK0_POPJA